VKILRLQICSESGENLACELGYPGRCCKFALPAAPNPNFRNTMRGPVPYTRRLQCFTFHLLPVSQHSLSVLFPPEAPYTVIASFKLLNTLTDACMPHLDAGLAPTPLDHPHLRYNPPVSSPLLDVHCRPSHCPPRWMVRCMSSLNLGIYYTENCDHSSMTMTMPLRTKKITNGTNDSQHAY